MRLFQGRAQAGDFAADRIAEVRALLGAYDCGDLGAERRRADGSSGLATTLRDAGIGQIDTRDRLSCPVAQIGAS